MIKETFSEWSRHEAPRLGAALAYYSVLSLAPLLVLTVAIVGLAFDRSTAQHAILAQVQSMLGADGSKAIQGMLESAQKSSGRLASIMSIFILFIGASGVFGELHAALNRIWEVKAEESSGVMAMIKERVLSFGMVLAIGFLLLVSLLLSAVLSAMGHFFGSVLPFAASVAGVINFIISFTGIAILFALMFRYVPDEKVDWSSVWVGAIVTAFLFTVGKSLIGLYLGKAAIGSAYGAAGSLVVIVVWVYYSAQIVFFGAEFTHVYSKLTRNHAVSPGSQVLEPA